MSKPTNLPDALIIVDVQRYFINDLRSAPMNKLIEAVCREVRWAKKHNLPIICLEYTDICGTGAIIRTAVEIRNEIGKYHSVWYVRKNSDGGGNEVNDVVQGLVPDWGLASGSCKLRRMVGWRMGKKNTTFRICGVNLEACVQDTTNELLDMGYNVDVVRGATRNVWDNKPVTKSRWWHERIKNREVNVVNLAREIA